MNTPEPVRIDRRTAIAWMLRVSAAAMLARSRALGSAAAGAWADGGPPGYGTDPNLVKAHTPGEYWPLTFSEQLRRQAAVLSDIVIPEDAQSPSASKVGVVDFLDEWVSAPYPDNVRDKKAVLGGLAWLDGQSTGRFGRPFADAGPSERLVLCEEMSGRAPVPSGAGSARTFFRLFRDLVASGYYTTPVGMKDLGYTGNIPLAKFEGPPAELIARLGLRQEVLW